MSIVRELRQAVVDCNARGLMESSRWAAQQLAGLPEEETGTGVASLEPVQPVWSREDDRHALARCHFDVKVLCLVLCLQRWALLADVEGESPSRMSLPSCVPHSIPPHLTPLQEYRSAAHVLSDCTSPKSTFLRLYSLYLAGEKRKE